MESAHGSIPRWQQLKLQSDQILDNLESKYPKLVSNLKEEFAASWAMVNQCNEEVLDIISAKQKLKEMCQKSNDRLQSFQGILSGSFKPVDFGECENSQFLEEIIASVSNTNKQSSQNNQIDSLMDNKVNQTENDKVNNQAQLLSVSCGDKLCIVGGLDGTQWVDSVHLYEPVGNVWTELPNMPIVKYYCASIIVGDKLVVTGGVDEEENTATVYFCDLQELQWQKGNDMLQARKGHCIVDAQNSPYVLGGRLDDLILNTVEVWDMKKDKWFLGPELVQPRLHTTVAIHEGCIYAVGGFNGKSYLTSIERLDPREGKWSICGQLQVARGSHISGCYDGRIYSVCGYDGKSFHNKAEFWDIRTQRSQLFPDCPLLHAYGAGDILNGQFFIYGGKSQHGEFLRNFSMLDLQMPDAKWEVLNQLSTDVISDRAYHQACVVGNMSSLQN